MRYEDLASVNAFLNFVSFVLLLTGYRHIKAGRKAQHRKFMLSAIGTSTLFLISYLIYHAKVGSVPFQGEGWSRPVYFAILISHIILAAAIVPLVLTTVFRALKENFDAHKRIARWTFPLWLFVSVSGVVVYLMLYHLFR